MAIELRIWIENSTLADDDQYNDLHALGVRITETMRPENRRGEYGFSVEENFSEDDEDTVRVWIIEHDHPEVGYVVNDEDDMRGNFDDLVNDDLMGYRSFGDYLDSWRHFDMPREIFESPDQHDRIDWIDLNK